MAATKDLTAYLAKAGASTREGFARENPYPFLVRIPDNARLDDDPWGDELSFTTNVEGLNDEDDDEDLSDTAPIIAPVTKREGGAFPDRIGVGRARNCDVVLRFGTVSKLHAQLRAEGTGWTITDLDSANGTSVNGVAIKPRTPQSIALGAKLRFGRVEVELINAATLWERLRARLR